MAEPLVWALHRDWLAAPRPRGDRQAIEPPSPWVRRQVETVGFPDIYLLDRRPKHRQVIQLDPQAHRDEWSVRRCNACPDRPHAVHPIGAQVRQIARVMVELSCRPISQERLARCAVHIGKVRTIRGFLALDGQPEL